MLISPSISLMPPLSQSVAWPSLAANAQTWKAKYAPIKPYLLTIAAAATVQVVNPHHPNDDEKQDILRSIAEYAPAQVQLGST